MIGFPQLLKIEFSSFPERGTKTSIFLLFLDVRMTLTQFYSYYSITGGLEERAEKAPKISGPDQKLVLGYRD